jgi:GTP-binding protein Era
MFKSGFTAIIGRPNVGKSTLLNAMIGEKVAITAPKPQTTRNTIRGIYSEDGCQIVFIDTPGIMKPRNKLGEYMTDSALATLAEVDAILFVTDEPYSDKGGDIFITEKIAEAKHAPAVLIINKTDLMGPEAFKTTYEAYEKTGLFTKILGTQASEGTGIPAVLGAIKNLMPAGPQYFPDGMITDRPERFIASEIIREKILHYLRDEVPHGVAVEIESYKEEEKLTRIGAVIYTEKKSHKGIIIGKAGHTLKGIGKSARQELEAILGTKVFLELWVKIKENWRDSDFMLSNLGYKE